MKATIADFALARANIYFKQAWEKAEPVEGKVMYRLSDDRFKDLEVKDLR